MVRASGQIMNFKLIFIFWAVMVVIAIVNGYFGQAVVSKALGDYGSHLYRTFFIIAVIFVFSNVYIRKTGLGGELTPALLTGLSWLALSITFEFGFGHFVFGFPWEKITGEYRLSEGRLWALVLASEVIAPVVNSFILRP